MSPNNKRHCSTGIITGGLGITFAHELIHKDGVDRQLGMWMLSIVCYGHFAIEHVEGHHKNVATYQDPATSRLGESIYAFLPRSSSVYTHT